MSVIFALLCILTAVLMLVLLEIEVDLKYCGRLLIVLHIGIFALELRSKRNKSRLKSKRKNLKKESSGLIKLKKNAAYIQLIIKLIEGSNLKINKIHLPDVLPCDYKTEYIKNAAYSAIISIFAAYLTSKSLKLTESDGAYENDGNKLLLDITLTTRIIYVLKSLFVMLKRFKEIKAEENRING